MSFLSAISKPVAAFTAWKLKRDSRYGVSAQQTIFEQLMKRGMNTAFGRDHHLSSIHSYNDFKQYVPIRDYEALKLYIDRVINGESDVLWPGKPLYLSKTSGTTSGIKYIPITS